jgi:hypothetical protein
VPARRATRREAVDRGGGWGTVGAAAGGAAPGTTKGHGCPPRRIRPSSGG